jgi:hypothetical protein
VIAWVFSIFISLALPIGKHWHTKLSMYLYGCIYMFIYTVSGGFDNETVLIDHHCGIYSPIYMLCSSIFAFYLPCVIMSITYGYIFYTLKRRLRTIQLQVGDPWDICT